MYTTDSTALHEPSLVSTGLHRSPQVSLSLHWSPGVSIVLVSTCLNKSPLVSWSPLVSAGLCWSPGDHWRLKETSRDQRRPVETSGGRPAETSVGSLRNSLQTSGDHHRLGETKGDRGTHGGTCCLCHAHFRILFVACSEYFCSITNDTHI